MKKLLKLFSVFLILFLYGSLCFGETCTLDKIIDGDTIICSGEKIRLIGIDAPESFDNPKARRDSKRTGQDLEAIFTMGKQAKDTLEYILRLADNKVELEFDVQRKDKYGRTLAYVFLKDLSVDFEMWPPELYLDAQQWVFVNAAMISSGFASPMTIPPNVQYADLFNVLYREAQVVGRGLWHEQF